MAALCSVAQWLVAVSGRASDMKHMPDLNAGLFAVVTPEKENSRKNSCRCVGEKIHSRSLFKRGTASWWSLESPRLRALDDETKSTHSVCERFHFLLLFPS